VGHGVAQRLSSWRAPRKLGAESGSNCARSRTASDSKGFGAVKTSHPTTASLGSRCALAISENTWRTAGGRWLEMPPRTAASSLSVKSSLCAPASGKSRRNRPTPSLHVPPPPLSGNRHSCRRSERLRGSGGSSPDGRSPSWLLRVRGGSASQGRLMVKALLNVFVMARPPKARSRTWQQLRKLASCKRPEWLRRSEDSVPEVKSPSFPGGSAIRTACG